MDWFVVRTEPQHELAASALLGGYCPTVRGMRRVRGRVTEVTSAMLPGYVFAAGDGGTVLRVRNPGSYAAGSMRVLGVGGMPQVVRDDVINAVRQVEREVAALPVWERSKFRIGQSVRLGEGSPMAGMIGTLTAVRNAVARVKLRMLGGEREVSVPLGMIEIPASGVPG